MSTLTTTRLATLPRVNLLPPEIEQQRRFRQVQIGLAGAVAAAVAVAAGLVLVASGDVGSAQTKLEASQARQAQLQRQTAEFAEVPLVKGQVDAAKGQLDQAMGQEVRWSYFLNDLSLKVPNRVWLSQMTMTQSVDPAAAAASATPGGYLAPGIGTVAFEGHAFSHNDVAAWLDSLAKQKGYSQAYFSDSSVDALGDHDNAVKFSSTVTLTDDALSKRYVPKAGN